MKRLLGGCLLTATLLAAPLSRASFHTFAIDQVYSNADGSVQFIVLHEVAGFSGQEFLAGHAITSNGPGGSKAVLFPNNLPSSNTGGRRVLIATAGFAALGIVAPDYIIPNGFVPLMNGTVDYAGVDLVNYASLPTDGTQSLYRNGTAAPNLATNFAGASASASVQAPPPTLNYQGMWWNSPPGSESGWGINFAHQGDTIFATWFTFDTNGAPMLLSVTATKTAPGVYSGDLFRAVGARFDAFDPTKVMLIPSGTATFTFADGNHAQFHYKVTGVAPTDVEQTKTITRQEFGPLPTCTYSAQPDFTQAANYQDTWFNAPANSESGWGINFAHEGDTIFATWFTYHPDGTSLLLVAVATKQAPGVGVYSGPEVYSGDLLRSGGTRFDAFDPTKVVLTPSGTATFTFADGNHAQFHYKVTGIATTDVEQTKPITRQLFVPPAGTLCQ